jgi:hypothetical protein
MPEIRLVKKYPHIKDEDVTSIFQEGYIKGFENGRKGAIPIEWIKSKIDAILDSYPDGNEETEILCKLLYEWEKENESNVNN